MTPPPAIPRADFASPAQSAAPEPAAAGRTPQATWPLDREGIRGAIRATQPKLKECYVGWSRDNPELGGKLSVTFTVVTAPDDPTRGKVTGAALTSSELAHPFLEGCVLNLMQGLRFDAPAGGTLTVNYPLRFEQE